MRGRASREGLMRGHPLKRTPGQPDAEIVANAQRKAKMAQLSTGGFVVLPGGYGTFEELLEMVTWNQVS